MYIHIPCTFRVAQTFFVHVYMSNIWQDEEVESGPEGSCRPARPASYSGAQASLHARGGGAGRVGGPSTVHAMIGLFLIRRGINVFTLSLTLKHTLQAARYPSRSL